MTEARRPADRVFACLVAATAGAAMMLAGTARAADRSGAPLTVTRPFRPPAVVPSPLMPGAPIPWSGSPLLTPPDLSVVDGETRFLAEGAAEARCPGERIVFVPGVVNPYRPTLPGDGAFMCRRDAVAQGFIGP